MKITVNFMFEPSLVIVAGVIFFTHASPYQLSEMVVGV